MAGQDRPRTAQTLPRLLADAAERYAGRPLMVDDRDGSVLTYGEAQVLVGKLAQRLVDERLKPGETVLVCAPTHPESVLLFWAATSVGLVFVPVDCATPAAPLGRIAASVAPRLVACDRERLSVVSELGCSRLLILDDSETGSLPPPATLLSDWLGEVAPSSHSLPEVAPESSAAVLFTSGTTGARRGVELTHDALCRSGELVAETFAWRADDVLLGLGDLDAMSGLRSPCVATLQAGCSFVIAPPHRTANVLTVIDCIRDHRCTLLSTAPGLLRQIIAHAARIDTADLATLRQIVSVASALRAETITQFRERYGIPIHNTWGMTETTGLCIAVPAGQVRPGDDTIGIPVGCEAKIVDERGARLGPGAIGELRVRGDTLMRGYWRDAAATARAVRDGWLLTGDLAAIRADGCLVIAGRRSEFVKNAMGNRVHPSEVEEALERHPAVAEAGACGFLSRYGDEQLAAFVVPATAPPNPDHLIAALRRHVIAEIGPHRAPRVLRLTDALPRNKLGKLRRQTLAEKLEQE